MSNSDSKINGYFALTRTGTYGFVAALPLLLAYEFLILRVNIEGPAAIRVGADVWIKQFLMTIGGREQVSIGAITVFLGLMICFFERKKRIRIRAGYFPLMLVESACYSVILSIIVSRMVTEIFSVSAIAPALSAQGISALDSYGLKIALSLGAGIYEELLFRVLLVSVFFLGFNALLPGKRKTVYFVAAIFAALIFSGVHYIGPYGDTLTAASFVYRFLFGLALNAVFIVRGFAIAAWSHALYDIMVVTLYSG